MIAGARALGGRALNEDAVFVSAADRLAVVADGAGGVCAGVVAGQVACAGLARLLAIDDAAAPIERMRAAFAAINAVVFAAARDERLPAGELGDALYQAIDDEARGLLDAARDPMRMSLRGMCAAAVACQLRGDTAIIGHVGDARAYRLRGGALTALTRDHDLAAEFPAWPRPIAADLARICTRMLGAGETIDPGVAVVEIAAGDTLVLCTDGLHDVVPDEGIAEILRASAGAAAARCDALIARALADGGRYPDNVAVAIIDA